MTLSKNSTITAIDIINLKNTIKAEMARRNGYGDVSAFSSATYDFMTPPTVNKVIIVEQGQKIIDIALRIKDIPNLKNVAKNDIVHALDIVNSSFATYKNENMTGNVSSCRGACTGLCFGTCTTGCIGCSAGCTGCTGTCTGCNTTCTSACSGCIDACKGCNAVCTGCNTTCTGTCLGCTSTCNGCTGSCIGCSNNCSGTAKA